jgi:TetR/AcrR family transcriptional repressor of nem operon
MHWRQKTIHRLVLDRYVRLALETCSAIFESGHPPLIALKLYFNAATEEVLVDQNHKGCFILNTELEVASYDQKFGEVVTKVFNEIREFVHSCVGAGQGNGSTLTLQPAFDVARLELSTILGMRVVGNVRNSTKYRFL